MSGLKVSVEYKDNWTSDLKKIQADLRRLPAEAHKEFVQLTPIDRGNARRKTTLKGNVIDANYPYAQRLNEGWSKQAPRGMEEPWTKWLENKFKKILGK